MNQEIKEKILSNFNEGDTFSTKELAAFLGVSTKEAYKICTELDAQEVICKFGYYKTDKNGGMVFWDHPDGSTLKPNSLHWQVSYKLD